jgi:hypothetical protein
MGINLLIAQNPVARIGIAAATVVYCDLLYNQSMLVGNVQKETPLGMAKS